jgi:hypothetical protein
VYIATVPTATVAITHVTPQIRFLGSYPTTPLVDGQHAGFAVKVAAHVWVPAGGASGRLAVTGAWGAKGMSDSLTLAAGESTVSVMLNATAAQIKLWWPNGVGEHPLYNLTAQWISTLQPAAAPATAVRRVGFRVFALVRAVARSIPPAFPTCCAVFVCGVYVEYYLILTGHTITGHGK